MSRRIRKQVDELRAADFEAYPCWEYASDEERRRGQDECTVRPLDNSKFSVSDGQVIAQAIFFFPNGRVRLGAITLNAGDGPPGHQPVLFLSKGSLYFYNGSLEPSAKDLRAFMRSLEEVCPSPFPIRYVSTVQAPDGRPFGYGELRGLYWLADWRTNELRVA